MSIYSPLSPHSRVFAASAMLSPTTMFVFGGCAKHGPCPSRDAWLFNGESSSWTALDFCFDVRYDRFIVARPFTSLIAAVDGKRLPLSSA
jgi:hypothetical protein